MKDSGGISGLDQTWGIIPVLSKGPHALLFLIATILTIFN